MKILTGNDLPTGDVIWWTGQDWSRHVEDAVDVGDKGEAIASSELLRYGALVLFLTPAQSLFSRTIRKTVWTGGKAPTEAVAIPSRVANKATSFIPEIISWRRIK